MASAVDLDESFWNPYSDLKKDHWASSCIILLQKKNFIPNVSINFSQTKYFLFFGGLFPKQAWPEGVLADLRASGSGLASRGLSVDEKCYQNHWFYNICETKLLWLQCGGPPHHGAAATATFFSQTLIKPTKY